MLSALCEAVALCHSRRLRQAGAAAPVPVAIVVGLVVAAPLVLLRVGGAVGEELAGPVGVRGVTEALVVGPVLAAAAAGAAAAMAYPGRLALGEQVAAGPCGEIEVTAAILVVPVLVGAIVVLPCLLAVCVAVSDELPGGAIAGVALAVATGAGLPAGAVVAEGGLAAVRGSFSPALAVLAGVIAWVGIGVVHGSALLGPLATVGAALRGSGSSWVALLEAGSVASALSLAWLTLAASRPPERCPTHVGPRSLIRAGRLPVPAAVAVTMMRRADVRFSTAAALAFGLAGVAIATTAAAAAPTPFLLATTTSLLTAILCSLAMCGALLGGVWLWWVAPASRRLILASAALVGVAATALPVAAVGAAAIAVSGASPSSVGVVAALVAAGSAAALVAGSVVPWNGGGSGDQLTTFAAFGGIAVTASIGVGLVGPRLVSYGLPDAVVVLLVCLAAMGGALCALDRRLGEGAR